MFAHSPTCSTGSVLFFVSPSLVEMTRQTGHWIDGLLTDGSYHLHSGVTMPQAVCFPYLILFQCPKLLPFLDLKKKKVRPRKAKQDVQGCVTGKLKN